MCSHIQASDTYSNLDSRPFTHSARNVHSDGDTPPILTRRFKQQQQHSDSVDSALNRMVCIMVKGPLYKN